MQLLNGETFHFYEGNLKKAKCNNEKRYLTNKVMRRYASNLKFRSVA